MRKIFTGTLFVIVSLYTKVCYAAGEVFDILPDLPENLYNAAQASSVSTIDTANNISQTVGQEPNFLSMIFSLIFVILLIYITGILYTKLNKFGAKTLKTSADDSKISVISTTPLGANKTLHVVELNGKRMLIGASTNSIDLIKDLGNYPPNDNEEEACFSKIEIPNIRIPKIEIPKIEIPGFTRVMSKHNNEDVNDIKEENEEENFEFSEIYEEENPDGIIDDLFKTTTEQPVVEEETVENDHKVNPDEFALYKKYL